MSVTVPVGKTGLPKLRTKRSTIRKRTFRVESALACTSVVADTYWMCWPIAELLSATLGQLSGIVHAVQILAYYVRNELSYLV
eukprot:5228648-Amphidinium_carterae.1